MTGPETVLLQRLEAAEASRLHPVPDHAKRVASPQLARTGKLPSGASPGSRPAEKPPLPAEDDDGTHERAAALSGASAALAHRHGDEDGGPSVITPESR